MAGLTPEQEQLLAVAASRQSAAAQQPSTASLTPDQQAILLAAQQRKAWGNAPADPLGMPDAVNKQPAAAGMAKFIAEARTKRGAREEADKQERVMPPSYFDDMLRSSFVKGVPFGDEIGGAMMAPVRAAHDWANGKGFDLPQSYDQSVELERELQRRRDKRSPKAAIVGSILGGATALGGVANAGFLAGARNTLPSLMGRGMADGAITGTVYGSGEGEDLASRGKNALWGAGVGGTVGALLPPVATAVTGTVKGAVRPFVAPFMPERFANSALGQTLEHSGMTADQVVQSMRNATADNQGMFTVADAMGHAGRRALTPAVRTPNNMRQQIADFLMGRQQNQGARLSNFMAEGFAAPDTAAQRTTSLTTARNNNADVNYAAARNSAGTVDPSAAIQAADDFLTPGATRVMNPGNNIRDDSVESAVRRARSYLTDDNSVLTDFNAAFRAKRELDNMIDGAKPTVQHELRPIRDRLDNALASASSEYAGARDAYRQESRAIEAVDTGRNAASSRTRAEDNMQQFAAMSPEEQAAFRAGYADPTIARIEGGPIGEMTNKARPLMSEKTGMEFPAFAAPGRADQLGNRITREQRMFETNNAALGGSKTADNLADMENMSGFDPAVMGRLFRGDLLGAAAQGAKQAIQLGRGQPPRVLERVGRSLIETNPDAAGAVLRPAQARRVSNQNLRDMIYDMLIGQAGEKAGQNGLPSLR